MDDNTMNSDIFRRETDEHGLERIVIETASAQAVIYRHGAHLVHWQPAGEEPVLFLSQQSYFEPGKPIRGGVPIIFPWFGPKADDDNAPAHGWARLQEWDVESLREVDESDEAEGSTEAEVVLTLDSARVPAAKEAAFLRFRACIGASLTMELEIENRSAAPLRFEEALHTYFAVQDAREIEVTGLEEVPYFSKAAAGGPGHHEPGGEPIEISREVDGVYAPTEDTVTILDEDRDIVVEKANSRTTVVWNPHIAKAAAMPDFGDDEWPFMVCVETANVGDYAVELAPGEKHTMRAVISIAR